jgi:predicted cupin superfamily sugar epimerase
MGGGIMSKITGRLSAGEVIRLLGLEPLVNEGGMIGATYRSQTTIGEKSLCSAIYFFLSGKAFSHLHRLPTDEVYHFYAGDTVEMLMLLPGGKGERLLLGNDLISGERPQIVMPAGCWQGSHLAPGGDWALMGTTMSPGFVPGDYEHGNAGFLISRYPDFAPLIEQLTGGLIYK